MTYSLAKEGKKYNIGVNAIAPLAASRMTECFFFFINLVIFIIISIGQKRRYAIYRP